MRTNHIAASANARRESFHEKAMRTRLDRSEKTWPNARIAAGPDSSSMLRTDSLLHLCAPLGQSMLTA
jgi:hypothetical protein